MSQDQKRIDELCVNTLRILSIDQVAAANSGHPGLPLGAAAPAYVIWSRFLRHNPANPDWPDRDRFILSAGHGSTLLYSLLHLFGYDLSLEDLKNFRKKGSRTPGHPEYGLTPGVEATTGPLGQGFAMGVGMALAEARLAAQFNTPEFQVIDHYTYALVSDGDLMEGISSEAASLAGNLGLGKMIYVYDDNQITIEGSTDITFTENVAARFESYGWQVLRVSDGNDMDSLTSALREAQEESGRPSLIITRTHIGYGSPRQDTAKAHGEPLGDEGVRATKEYFGFPPDQSFAVPPDVLAQTRMTKDRGQALEAQWRELMAEYGRAEPAKSEKLALFLEGRLPRDWEADIPVFRPQDKPLATRAASGLVLQGLNARVDNLLGGSADLAPSNKTMLDNRGTVGNNDFTGSNIHFGIREHAMAAAVNGMALHGGVIPYGATFLIFSDYCRPALRLAALMNVPSIFVFTHDSIGVGEDGPTHQPIEHLMSLRVMPNLTLYRPADANETAAAWRSALERPGPAVLALTRQKLPILDPRDVADGPDRGAYVLADSADPQVLLLATGSEVSLIVEASQSLKEKGIRARVVSMPCWEIFLEQEQAYQEEVLPPEIKTRLAVEAGVTLGWERWVGDQGAILGLDRFGASAPGAEVFEEVGLTVEAVVSKTLELLGGNG